MYEISFTNRDTIIVKGVGKNLWKSATPETSELITKLYTNNFLRTTHTLFRGPRYLGKAEALLKYYNKEVHTSVYAYCFMGYLLVNNRKRLRWQFARQLVIPNEMYIPNILFNGRGLWVVNYNSPLAGFVDKKNYDYRTDFKVHSIDKNGNIVELP